MKLPFTGSPKDALFRYYVGKPEMLSKHNIDVTAPILEALYREACGHLRSATEFFGPNWWRTLKEADVVNIANPEKSLYHLIALRLGKSLNSLCHTTAQKAEELLNFRLAPKLANVLNYFFNEIIRELRQKHGNPALIKT